MRRQTCGQPTDNRPALCDQCRAERATHGRAKATARWAALLARLDKRRWPKLDARVSDIEAGVSAIEAGTRGRAS